MDNYTNPYEKENEYCYKGTDILVNKLNIKDNSDLFKAERSFVLFRTNELLDNPIKGNFDFEHLKAIHKYLFQDLYTWAGKTRNCDIAKGSVFCLAINIYDYANKIFSNLKDQDYFIEYDFNKKIEKIALLFADINALHPFREGNGRAQREFIENLAYINGIKIELTNISQEQMVKISIESLYAVYDNLIKEFKENATAISPDEQLKKIEEIVLDKRIKVKLMNSIKNTYNKNEESKKI